jgi:hypothetical protein
MRSWFSLPRTQESALPATALHFSLVSAAKNADMRTNTARLQKLGRIQFTPRAVRRVEPVLLEFDCSLGRNTPFILEWIVEARRPPIRYAG